MRKTFTAALLSAAVASIGLLPSTSLLAQSQTPATTRPAEIDGQIPVRQVILYSSGVGYFEHFGNVQGNGSTELRFKTQQINDILKSLVLQDMDKGKIGVITYPSQDPVSKTLKSFQIDITANPGLSALLGQLRGAKVAITSGPESVTGTVLGVEKKARPVGGGKDAVVVDVWYVNLITDSGIRSVSLEDVRSLELQDPKLKEELKRALAALASARDQDKKPVTISFSGEGERRIRIGYVVETPVWKTSYRLMVSDKGAGGAATKPAADQGAAGKTTNSGSLQGWAIVENQTDNDWTDVQLSLVSGRPISFIMDLYQPLYIPRPVVQPELYASLRPQTYDGGIDRDREIAEFGRVAGEKQPDRLRRMETAGKALKDQPAGGERGSAGGGVPVGNTAAAGLQLQAMDPTASIASVASAAKVGELFQYTVGNVSLPRQSSAMIPVVTDEVEVEKLSIYNQAVLAKNPLLGARVKNTTAKHLLQGPITVLEGSTYAGDARIDDLPPGQERLISYGVDQQVIVQAQNNSQKSSLVSGKIVKGVLILTHKEINSQDYVVDNKSDKEKTLVIEHPRYGVEWKLTYPPKAEETTDSLYRFKSKVAPGGASKLTVAQEWVRAEEIAILPMNTNSALVYSRTQSIPQDVRDALAKAAELKQALATTDRLIGEEQAKINQITQEQNRIRDNMKSVAQNAAYYTRLLTKLGEQETQIEEMQKGIISLKKQAEEQRKAMEDYVNGLNLG